MRDLARRVQALRKEMGFTPTDVLDSAHIAELDAESMTLLEPYLEEMAGLIRTGKVYLHSKRAEVEDADWHESELDGKKIFLKHPLRHPKGANQQQPHLQMPHALASLTPKPTYKPT
jgi:hypothetical protein